MRSRYRIRDPLLLTHSCHCLQTLGDEQKRKDYDNFGTTSANQGQQRQHGGGFDNFFNQGPFGFHFNFGGFGQDTLSKYRITLRSVLLYTGLFKKSFRTWHIQKILLAQTTSQFAFLNTEYICIWIKLWIRFAKISLTWLSGWLALGDWTVGYVRDLSIAHRIWTHIFRTLFCLGYWSNPEEYL